MYLPDVNFWLAVTFQSHVHHLSARSWFEGFGVRGCSFCRMTQQGFLRLATNPRAFGEEAVSLAEAWRLYDVLAADPRIRFADEPAGVEALWRHYTQGETFSAKIWNDAFLAAVAQTANLELVTFDQGFRRYTGLRCILLS